MVQKEKQFPARCLHCNEEVILDFSTLEARRFKCPFCQQVCDTQQSIRKRFFEQQLQNQEKSRAVEEKRSKRAEKIRTIEECTAELFHSARERYRAYAAEQKRKTELQKQKDQELRKRRAKECERKRELEEKLEAEQRKRMQRGLCPKCGADAVGLTKAGYDDQAGLGCCMLAGPAGLLLGAVGSGETVCVCKACGHQYKPGDHKVE